MAKELDGFVSNAHVFLGEETIEVGVDGLPCRARWRKNAERTFLAVHDVNQVRQDVEDGQVVFDHDDPFGFGQGLNDTNDTHAFVDVKVGGGFVKEVDVHITQNRRSDGHALQLTARKLLDRSVHQVVNPQRASGRFQQTSFVDFAKQVSNGSRDSFWKTIHVLGFHCHSNFAVLDSDEKVPQFAFGQRVDDLVPLRFLIQPVAEVGNHSPGKRTDRCRFPHAVGPENPHHAFL